MIRLVSATPGSGKTCMVIEWLLRELDKGFYKSIYANIEGLKIMGIHPLLDDWRKVPDEHKPCLYIVDEAQYFPEFMKETTKANEIGKALSTHRHFGIDFWLITQSPKLLNSYVLENVGEHVHLYRPKKAKTVTVYWWSYAVTSMTKTNFKQADDVQKWRLNPHMFQYYKSTVAVTDGKARISHRNVSAIIVFCVIMGVIYYFISNGANSFEKMQHKEDKTLGVIDNNQMPNQPNKSPVAQNTSQPVSDLSVECRKGVNVEKPECKKWFDEISKNGTSVSTGENVRSIVVYNPSKPFDDELQQQITYEVTSKPVFSGCMKKNGKYVGYTQQGTIIDVSQDDCRRLIENGDRPFNYFASDRSIESFDQANKKTTDNSNL